LVKVTPRLVALIFGFIVIASIVAGGLSLLISYLPREENGVFIDYPNNTKITGVKEWSPPSKGVVVMYFKEAEREECKEFDKTWKKFIELLKENNEKNITAIRIVVDKYPDKMHDKLAENMFYEWHMYLTIIKFPFRTPLIIILKDGVPATIPLMPGPELRITSDQMYNLTKTIQQLNQTKTS